MKCAFVLYLVILIGAAQAQVLDVNGDQLVGPEEAVSLSENWKGPASAANDHNHLGQVWTPEGSGDPLTLRGDFPDRILFPPIDLGGKLILTRQSAPLVLDNTIENRSDLLLGGEKGVISAIDESSSALELRSNGSVAAVLNVNLEGELAAFEVRNATGDLQGAISETGFLFVEGNGLIGGSLTVIDGVTMKRSAGKTGVPSESADFFALSGPRPTDIYSGRILLDDAGGARVNLPTGSPSDYTEYLYQLTPIGRPAPGLYVAAEIEKGEFQIAGGSPGQTVCWQVTGVRNR